jgi:hypothetical protein
MPHAGRRPAFPGFISRMAGQGIKVVRAHYFLLNFYLKLGYSVDKRLGTLVKFLYPERPDAE